MVRCERWMTSQELHRVVNELPASPRDQSVLYSAQTSLVKMRFTVCMGLVAISVSSCAEPFAPPRATVSALEVVEQSSSQPGQMSLTVAVRVENVTDADIYFNFCGSSLEREAAPGQWEPFAGVTCITLGYANPLDGMLRISAGGIREMPLHLYSWGQVGVDLFASTYRLRLPIATPMESAVVRGMGYNHSVQVLTTNEFSLKQK